MYKDSIVLKALIKFLKYNGIYDRWIYCIHHYPHPKYTMPNFIHIVTLETQHYNIHHYLSCELMTRCAPFSWDSHNEDAPNSDIFWFDMSRKFQQYFKENYVF